MKKILSGALAAVLAFAMVSCSGDDGSPSKGPDIGSADNTKTADSQFGEYVSNTYIATALAVTYVGATPVFVEPDIRTYNIDPAKIEEKIAPATKAIMPVHLCRPAGHGNGGLSAQKGNDDRGIPAFAL